MATYYLEFSQSLTELTSDEVAWLEQELAYVSRFGDQECTVGELPINGPKALPDWTGYRFLRDYLGDEDELDEIGFHHQFVPDAQVADRQQLWVQSDESSDLGKLAHLVQNFLRQFRPDQCWSLTYATTCSRPIVGEFGGGALFVTARTIAFHSTWDWTDRQLTKFTKRQQANSRREPRRRK